MAIEQCGRGSTGTDDDKIKLESAPKDYKLNLAAAAATRAAAAAAPPTE